MIIIEGVDGSGKSTLVQTLAERLELPVAPRVVSKDMTPMVDLRKWTDENLAAGFQEMIFDRHRLISEPIYGPVMHRHPDAGFWDLPWLSTAMAMLRVLRPVTIYCIPPFNVVWENLEHDPENREARAQALHLYHAYMAAACNNPHAMVYDYTAHNQSVRLATLEMSILARIKRWRSSVERRAQFR